MANTARDTTKRPAVAFLPWLQIAGPQKVAGLRLIPYQRSVLPGNLPGIRQRDLDAILSAYAGRPSKRLERATLLEVDTWNTGQDVARALPKLFRARDFLCFSALAARRLFGGHLGYCNSHEYELVVQAFTPGDIKSVAFTTRRRDGGRHVLWGSNEFAFHRPLHVADSRSIVFDQPLLRTLMRLRRSESWIHEAILEFNAANTDSSDVPVHVEVVMMKSAFDWLLQIDHHASNFINAIVGHMVPSGPVARPSGPLIDVWLAKPRAGGVIEAWAREFCVLRNLSAHGGNKGPKLVWSREAHLVFASVLFPLLLKKILADHGWYTLPAREKLRLSILNKFLAHDPMKPRRSGLDKHPWNELAQDAKLRVALESAFDRYQKIP
jgi:hypothetical protein